MVNLICSSSALFGTEAVVYKGISVGGSGGVGWGGKHVLRVCAHSYRYLSLYKIILFLQKSLNTSVII